MSPRRRAIGKALGDLQELLIVEQDVSEVHPLIRLEVKWVVAAALIEKPSATMTCFSHAEKFEEQQPGTFRVPESVSPDLFVHPHLVLWVLCSRRCRQHRRWVNH